MPRGLRHGDNEFTADRIVAWCRSATSMKTGRMASLDLPRPLGRSANSPSAHALLIAAAVGIPSLLMLVFLETFVAQRIRRVSQGCGSAQQCRSPGISLKPPPQTSALPNSAC